MDLGDHTFKNRTSETPENRSKAGLPAAANTSETADALRNHRFTPDVILHLQRVVGNSATQRLLLRPHPNDRLHRSLPDTENATSIQRQISLEDVSTNNYVPATAAQVAAFIGNDPDPAQVPLMPAIIANFIGDAVVRNYDSSDAHTKKLRKLILDEIVSQYTAATSNAVPNVLPLLDTKQIHALALYQHLDAYDLAELNTLVGKARGDQNINQVALRKTVRKYISEVDANATLRNDSRVNFLPGRQGEMVGLIGELRSLIATKRFSGNAEVFLGQDVDIGDDDTQDVDIYYKIGGKGYYFEVAATVDKLRDKINDGTQRANYDKIRKKEADAVLGYSVGAEHVWPDIFAGPHLVGQLITHKRYLRVDGANWSPDDLQALQPVLTHLRTTFIAKFQNQKSTLALLGQLDPNTFLGLSKAQAEVVAGKHLFGGQGREGDNFNWASKAMNFHVALRQEVGKTITILRARANGDPVITKTFQDIETAWGQENTNLDSIIGTLADVSLGADLNKHRSTLKKMATALAKTVASLIKQLDDAKAAQEGKKNAAYYQRTFSDAQAPLKTIQVADYELLTKR